MASLSLFVEVFAEVFEIYKSGKEERDSVFLDVFIDIFVEGIFIFHS